MLWRTAWCGGRCLPWEDMMGWLWAGNTLGQPLGPGSQAPELSLPGIDALKEKPLTLPGFPDPPTQTKGGFGGWQLSALPRLRGT